MRVIWNSFAGSDLQSELLIYTEQNVSKIVCANPPMEEYENSDSRYKREPARSLKQLNICVNYYIVYILTSLMKGSVYERNGFRK